MRFKPRSRALAASALAASLGLAGLVTVAPTAGAAAPTVVRYEGANRYETAAVAAAGSTTAVIAVSEGSTPSPDALAASALAGANNADILLTAAGNLPQDTEDALVDAAVTDAFLLGGESAVSADVQTAIEDLGITVTRIGGANRQETSALVADEIGAASTAILTGFDGAADALTSGPVAYAQGYPILITGLGDTLNSDVAAALASSGATDVVIVGGTDRVSQAVEDDLDADGFNVTRVGGSNRVETGALFADYAVANEGHTFANVGLVNGFGGAADAFAASTVLGNLGGVTIISDGEVLSGFAETALGDNAADIDTLHIFGGEAAISQAVEDAAVETATSPEATGVTTRPELVSAAIVSTTTAGQATALNPVGTVVSYTFDESLTALGALATFVVYDSTGARQAAPAAASISTGDNKTVLVRYAGIATTAAAATLTTATVELGAVTDTAGQQNPEGDAAIGTGSTSTLTAGTTSAPDLLSIGGFRDTLVPGTVAVDFTFDQAAFTQADGAAGLGLVSTDGRIIACAGPLDTDSGNTAPSGLNVVGGNGTTVITATCGQYPLAGPLAATTASAANTARGTAAVGSVGTTPPVAGGTVNGVAPAACGASNGTITNRCNPLQVTSSPDGASADPDLVSATFTPGATPATLDQVVYMFDENVQPLTLDSTDFNVYSALGVETAGLLANNPNTGGNQVNGTQVAIFYPNGTLANSVGASVEAGGVTAVAGANNANENDEVGVTNTTATNVTPGSTGAPDLLTVALSSTTAGFVTTFQATYTFDEALSGATAAGVAPQLFLHLADGARMVCTAAGNVTIGTGLNGLTTSQVAGNGYTFVDGAPDQSGTNTGVATSAQIGATVLGTVDQKAAPAAGDLGDVTAVFTPEGAAATTTA